MIRGVIFDMDGVLVDSEPIIVEAAVTMFREHGVAAHAADFLPFIGTGEARFLGGVAEKYGFALAIERDKTRTYDLYLELIKGRLQPIAGAVTFVTDCRRAGRKTAIATSADVRKMRGNLAEVGLAAAMFDAVVTGSDVVNKKPDPEVFLTAMARIALPADACLVIEDAPNGVLAAKRAGARCLGITSTFSADELNAAGADVTAPSLTAIPSAALA